MLRFSTNLLFYLTYCKLGCMFCFVTFCNFLNLLIWILNCSKCVLSSKLSLTCGGNVNHYKNVHHPIPTCGNREHPDNFQNKSVSSPFSWVSRYFLFLAKLKGRGRIFLKGAKRGATLWDYSQGHLLVIRDEKVSPFVKLEIILRLLCFSLEPLLNKHCRTWCFSW